MSKLPAKVPAPEGKVILWADYDGEDDEGVPLYLVNQTDELKSFDSQDGDIYIKLEFKDAAGEWRRAQSHVSSWCGNSYIPVELPPHSFVMLHGYQAKAGGKSNNKHAVRYARRDRTLVSNEGTGWVRQEDLRAVSLDSITAADVPYEITRKLEPQFNSADFEGDAIAALRDLAWYPRNEPAVRAVRELKNHVSRLPATQQRLELLKLIDDFFVSQAKPRPTGDKLVLQCIARIVKDSTADAAMSERTAWELLKAPDKRDADGGMLHQPETWRGVVLRAVELIQQQDAEEVRLAKEAKNSGVLDPFGEPPVAEAKFAPLGALRILSTPWLLDALLMDAEMESWVASGPESLRRAGAEGLMRRGRPEKLAEMAWKRSGAVQIDLLRILARVGEAGAPRRIPEAGLEEHRFWEHCAKHVPVETASALQTYASEPAFQRLLHPPLRDALMAEAEKSEGGGALDEAQVYRLSSALAVLASWGQEEDTGMLRSFLRHEGHVLWARWKDPNAELRDMVHTRQYVLREVAAKALIARGQTLPKNLTLEEEEGTQVRP